jgi:ribosomal protein L44E
MMQKRRVSRRTAEDEKEVQYLFPTKSTKVTKKTWLLISCKDAKNAKHTEFKIQDLDFAILLLSER